MLHKIQGKAARAEVQGEKCPICGGPARPRLFHVSTKGHRLIVGCATNKVLAKGAFGETIVIPEAVWQSRGFHFAG